MCKILSRAKKVGQKIWIPLFGKLIRFPENQRVFWLSIAESRVYLRYGYRSKLFRELRKESEFRQWCY